MCELSLEKKKQYCECVLCVTSVDPAGINSGEVFELIRRRKIIQWMKRISGFKIVWGRKINESMNDQ